MKVWDENKKEKIKEKNKESDNESNHDNDIKLNKNMRIN